MRTSVYWIVAAFALASVVPLRAQDSPPQDPGAQQHDHTHMSHQMADAAPRTWHFMYDGQLFALLNHQSGQRGGTEFVVPNWWMAMATRSVGSGQLTFDGMLSLDPATVGRDGYRELFQAGETLDGKPLVDRQHPHDFFMQLAGSWRVPLTDRTGFTIAGGPAGEPAIGPVAFMHRPSAADNPAAPLSHHTLDSTHISFGVVTLAVDRGPWLLESSIFNGREPDEHRWDFDFGPLDSYSWRLWYRPNREWELQGSMAWLHEPEALEPGDIRRSTVSASWFRKEGPSFSAVTAAYGRNDTGTGARSAFLLEGTRRRGANAFYGRFEFVQLDELLLVDDAVPEGHAVHDPIAAFTVGGARAIFDNHGFEGSLGADVTFYAVPDVVRPSYGSHPVSFHIFFQLRPPTGAMGRMWNMRMSQPMPPGHRM